MKLSIRLIIALLCLAVLCDGCFLRRKTTCPAYMKGAVTGMGGSKGKKQELFPKKMRKKK